MYARTKYRKLWYLLHIHKMKYAIISISTEISGPSNASGVFVHLHSLKTFKVEGYIATTCLTSVCNAILFRIDKIVIVLNSLYFKTVI